MRLYGHLGARFGRVHRFAVASSAEAVRALCSQVAGFRQYVQVEHSEPGYRVRVGRRTLGALEELHDPTGAKVIRIVPVAAGAKKGGLQIIIGIILIAASFIVPNPAGLTALAAFEAGNYAVMFSQIAFSVGTSLVLGGISSLLFSPPKSDLSSREAADNRPNFAFSGAVNTVAQGNPVAVMYGELAIGSQVVSAGLSAEPQV